MKGLFPSRKNGLYSEKDLKHIKRANTLFSRVANDMCHLYKQHLIERISKTFLAKENKLLCIEQIKLLNKSLRGNLRRLMNGEIQNREQHLHFQFMFIMMINTMFAPQRSQIFCEMKFKDMSFVNGKYIIDIVKEKNFGSNSYIKRSIVLPKCLNIFMKHFISIRENLMSARYEQNKSFMFFNKSGHHLTRECLSKMCKRITKQVLKKKLTMKEFRTLFCAVMYETLSRQELRVFNRMVDHSDETAAIYYSFHKHSKELLHEQSPIECLLGW